jgi:response regulator RpfG family c-di-GMP phosphodiesterase
MTLFKFAENSPPNQPKKTSKVWNILVVDDDEAIFSITQLALASKQIFGRDLVLYQAKSAQEAKVFLQQGIEFCMAFIDVVMEKDIAGLELIDWIRNDIKNQSLRIILRTGQAGKAPEEEVIQKYDINDYKLKTELTASKLITSVYCGIRGYRDIQTIFNSLNSFKKLIEASSNMLKNQKLNEFSTIALENLLHLMKIEPSSLYIVRQEKSFYSETDIVGLAASSGEFGGVVTNLSEIPEQAQAKINETFETKENIYNEIHYIGYVEVSKESSIVLYIEFEDDARHFKVGLAELFAHNLALILETLVKKRQTEQSQKELMYIVGDAIEARSKETGNHVKRVAHLCVIIAKSLNLEESFINAIKIAAPLHDIGKIGIPEHILHKPGKLNPEEWEIMKTHAEQGGNLLKKSQLNILKLGAKLAHYHHENWDGSGYPEGLKGLEIPLEARIMAIADVVDALGSKRSYKEPWSNDKILKLIKAESEIKFDPELVDIVVDKFDELMTIREKFPD